MKSEIKEKEPTEVTLEIEIESAKVDQAIDAVYQEYVQEIDIPGFRKGKVPKGLLKARFGDDIFDEDAQKQLVNEYLPQVFQQHDIEPVSEPEIDVSQFGEGEDFVFQATAEILPDVELRDYKNLEVTRPQVDQIDEEELDSELEQLRQEHAQLRPKEGPVKVGDHVTAEAPNGQETRVRIEDDQEDPSNIFLDHQVGDQVTWQRTEDEEPQELTIKAIKEVIAPELDDEFAKDLGYESIQEVRNHQQEELRGQNQDSRQQELQQKLLDQVIEDSTVNPPDKMVQRMVEDRMDSLKNQLGEESFTTYLKEQDQTEDELRDDLADNVRAEVKQQLVLDEIANREQIQISDQELEDKIQEEAKNRDTNPMKFRNQLEAQDSLESFKESIKREKVLQFLVDQADIHKREVSNE